MKTLKLTTLIALIAIMYGCHKNNDNANVLTDGSYSGQYTLSASPTSPAVTADIVIKIASPSYSTYSLTPNNVLTAKGSYEKNGSQVTFTDTLFFPSNINSGPILNGTYNFKVKADSLTLTEMINGYPIIYHLKRQ
jgi:hypothetical protein